MHVGVCVHREFGFIKMFLNCSAIESCVVKTWRIKEIINFQSGNLVSPKFLGGIP